MFLHYQEEVAPMRGKANGGLTLQAYVDEHFQATEAAGGTTKDKIDGLFKLAIAAGYDTTNGSVGQCYYTARKRAGHPPSPRARKPGSAPATKQPLNPERLAKNQAAVQQLKEAGKAVGVALLDYEKLVTDLSARVEQQDVTISELRTELSKIRSFKTKYERLKTALSDD